MNKQQKLVFLLGCLPVLLGCASYQNFDRMVRSSYYRQDYAHAAALIDRRLRSLGPNHPDRPLFLLEKASVALAMRQPAVATQALREADQMTMVLDLTGDPKEVGKYLFSDSAGMYRIQPYEQIMINTLDIIALLMQGRVAQAFGEVQRARMQERYWVTVQDQGYTQNPLVLFLGAIICRYIGETSRAAAFQAAFARMVGPAQAQQMLGPVPKQGEYEVLVLILNGKAPIKVGVRQRIRGTPYARIITGTGYRGDVLIYPQLQPQPSNFSAAEVMINGTMVGPCLDLLNIEQQAMLRYERERPQIMIAAASRLAFRAAVSSAAAYGVGEATRDKKHRRGNQHLKRMTGEFVNMLFQSLDVPDTRCWSLLPKNILVQRFVGPLGSPATMRVLLSGGYRHEITVQAPLQSGQPNVVLLVVP